MKNIIIDLDDTLSITLHGDYTNALPKTDVINKLRQYSEQGFKIVIYSSRNMRTYNSNVGKINVHTLPTILAWLDKHNVPYDEVLVGKPWCGFEGFYVDDKAIRPDEFVNLSYDEILKLVKKDSSN